MHKLLVKKFEQLSLNELYEIMALRMKVLRRARLSLSGFGWIRSAVNSCLF